MAAPARPQLYETVNLKTSACVHRQRPISPANNGHQREQTSALDTLARHELAIRAPVVPSGKTALLIVRERLAYLEGEKLVAGDAAGLGGPIAPAVRWFDGGIEFLAGQRGLLFVLKFQVIKEFQEHDPGE